MLDNLQKAVQIGESEGADYVEARYDDLTLRTLEKVTDNWKDILIKKRTGVGITCYYKGVAGFSFTAGTKNSEIESAVRRAVKLAKAVQPAAKLPLEFDKRPPIKTNGSSLYSQLVKRHPSSENIDYKIDLVDRMVASAQEHGKNISNISGLYGELFGQKLLTNSDISVLDWEFEIIDLRCLVTSKTESGDLVVGAKGFGGTRGLEIFSEQENTPEQIGKIAGLNAKEQIEAKACPAGIYKSLVENSLVGVLAHESFGHLSEGDFVVTGGSPLSEKIGERIGSEQATIIDSGVPDIMKYGGLYVPYDDQGIQGNETIILENGILKHYLHNRGTARNQNQEPTGNSRAIHFAFMPIPRMTNTYFAPGDLNGEEEALELLDTGIYAIQSSGGQVEGDGNFLFKAIRGYWVENGEKQYPIREVSLSGNILDLLKNVEGGTKDLGLYSGYFGGCGKGDQYPLPVGDGGPKLVISGVRFGGKA